MKKVLIILACVLGIVAMILYLASLNHHVY